MESREEFRLRPVGFVKTSASKDDVKLLRGAGDSRVEIYPEFRDALDGLEGFSHVFILSYFNQLRPDQIGPLRVKPRRLLSKGLELKDLPTVGVFALGSPTRPNPIGLSLVELLKVEEGALLVRGLDCFDGTPVLDVKAYRVDYRAESYEFPQWYRELKRKTGEDF